MSYPRPCCSCVGTLFWSAFARPYSSRARSHSGRRRSTSAANARQRAHGRVHRMARPISGRISATHVPSPVTRSMRCWSWARAVLGFDRFVAITGLRSAWVSCCCVCSDTLFTAFSGAVMRPTRTRAAPTSSYGGGLLRRLQELLVDLTVLRLRGERSASSELPLVARAYASRSLRPISIVSSMCWPILARPAATAS